MTKAPLPKDPEGPSTGARRTAPTPTVLVARLEQLRDEMRARYIASAGTIGRVCTTHLRSAHNLMDYLTLRGHDLRALQESLAELGVSSLGRAEEHVISSVERVIEVLHALGGRSTGRITESAVDFSEGRLRLHANAVALLGPRPSDRHTRIMVTMPTEAAWDRGIVCRLVAAGMDCARINGAHDGPDQWAAMASNISFAAAAAGRECPILFDLPGPKLRTGPVAPGPKVVRLHPRRDARGRATVPARARFVADAVSHSASSADDGRAAEVPVLPVPEPWLATLRPGDRVHMHDARGSARVLEVTAATPSAAWVAAWDTTYLETGTKLDGPSGAIAIGELPAVEQALRLRVGDIVMLTADLAPAAPGGAAPGGVAPGGAASGGHLDRGARFRIGCTLPEALACARVGHRVWFDDGRIG